MAAANVERKQFKALGRDERFWGYVFIAAPLIGFVIFTAIPLFGSLFLSLTEWDLVSDPEWIGTDNWEKIFSLKVVEYPEQIPEIHAETGEPLYLCGRSFKVPESEVDEYEGKPHPRNANLIMTCEARYVIVTASDLLPKGYLEAFTINIMDRSYLIGARDHLFWKSLYNTFFILLGIPLSLAMAVVLAIALNQGIVGTRFYRTFYYMPTIMPIAALALIWMWIFSPEYGLLKYLLQEIGLHSLANTNWLQEEETIKPSLIIMTIWRGLGYQVVIYVAGLQGIQRQLYEAAEIDGAGPLAKFRYITWPGLTPTTFFLLITSIIGGLQIFQEPYLMTGPEGGENAAAMTTVMLIWRNAFNPDYWQMGYAATQAWFLGALIMLVTLFNFLMAKRWVFYE